MNNDMPDKIYLIDLGNDIVWSDDPEPSDGIDSEDVTEYISIDLIKDQKISLLEEIKMHWSHFHGQEKIEVGEIWDFINTKISELSDE